MMAKIKDLPDDLASAYKAETDAGDALAEQRATSVELRAALDESQAMVRELTVPFEATRATRRTLEREYNIGEWAIPDAPTQVIGGE
jgi:hypothetical protein